MALAAFLLLPGLASAQRTSDATPRFELRGGLAVHNGPECGGGGTGATLGLAARTRGSWFVSGAVDLLDVSLLHRGVCELDLGIFDYQGQSVYASGVSPLDRSAPRLAAFIGRRLSGGIGVRSDITVGAGMIRTRRNEAAIDWQPWFGGAVTVHFSSGLGLQLEYGRRRVFTTYALEDTGVAVARFSRWIEMWRAGVAVPLGG